VILFPAIMVTFDEDEIWQRVEWADVGAMGKTE
jgi:hypothetical protein